MAALSAVITPFGQVTDNAILLEKAITEPVCEGLNIALASFQGLYIQYQKHHFAVEGAEFYSLHQFFEEGYDATKGHVHDTMHVLFVWLESYAWPYAKFPCLLWGPKTICIPNLQMLCIFEYIAGVPLVPNNNS